ncbi:MULTISPECIES: ribbon-helix-helix domain-containing protein [Thalassospira]|uniref:Type II toxin-antitoxin system ParD family antitoxin n=2 Tax=Thalassospira TaxID=168934 RepID=A0A367VWY8_9PROT|nr:MULTISPECIES: type II toxin-antitoxin system ParD family antitoxin [Thalassospira]MDG4721528.1 type II toxin-antitoxin system ParD family antitoxin [Thalassospira sp. FZY0004]RCK30371.1 hypothetical protein TH19_22535 [Thalassospira profundimaris]
MTVKSSISLTDTQGAFVRELVDNGTYPSASAVLQQGLELLRQKSEIEQLETEALRAVLQSRRDGKFIPASKIKDRLTSIATRKREKHAL